MKLASLKSGSGASPGKLRDRSETPDAHDRSATADAAPARAPKSPPAGASHLPVWKRSAPIAPRNAWYVAAFLHEVGRDPMERWILGEPVALYRTRDGRPVALDGRCPHHYFPLGKSPVRDDNVVCGYHGMTFAPDGTAVDMPTIGKPPAACNIHSYPVEERWQLLWIWPGDPAKADPALIPDLGDWRIDDPEFGVKPLFYREIPARYQLLHDNLLDLSHLEFLHAGTIGTPGISGTREERWVEGNRLTTRRLVENIPVPERLSSRVHGHDGRIDREFSLTFLCPSVYAGSEEFRDAETGRSFGSAIFFHVITPARADAMHYFFVRGRNFALPQAEEAAAIALLERTIREDVEAAVEVERMMSMSVNLPDEVLLSSDKTLHLGRRMLADMIRAEQAEDTGTSKVTP